MAEEHGQSSFLQLEDGSCTIFVSKGVNMDDARNSCCNQPRKTHQSIDTIEDSTQAKVIVVCFTMFQLVVLVADQVPCDTIVKVDENKGQNSRSSHLRFPWYC